ncbi:MAG: hypothetical protein A3J76_04410 [Candidatus Moranbacteria bacterium RBG_13_45_13]|nr:MAG: hypothetical protein A3J76_04410 [Candidatus Moranbacteria bacterium RBG_13_45_13]
MTRRLALILIFLALAASLLGGLFWLGGKKNKKEIKPAPEEIQLSPPPEEISVPSLPGIEEGKPPPPPVSMDRVMREGCVADGLLSQYNPDSDQFISLINRSNCYYLHRAVETWRQPPRFEVINNVMNRITKKDVVYGMFIAEALDTNDNYKNASSGHYFRFRKMCHRDSLNAWGEHTCKPTFSSEEYRDYLKYITRRAIDMGIQSFTFGQIYMQESSSRKYAPQIVKKIRAYAKKRGVDVVIGAQTGATTDPKYLKLFDYIEGGVGIDSNGDVENGPCLSTRGSCWALLWNKAYSAKSKNVLLHLDWTGIPSDDLDVFARMSPEKRAETLRKLHKKFTSQNMGFLMPYFGVLAKDNGGCYGPKKRYYSPDNAYGCRDEDAINAILGGK